MTPHRAVSALFHRFFHDCKKLRSNEREMQKLEENYFRYRNLLGEQDQIRDRLIKTFGILGVHCPDISQETAKLLIPVREWPTSEEVRNGLKLWQVLQIFLSVVDTRATIRDFKSFLFELGWTLPSLQAIDSAIRSHPEVFVEKSEGEGRFVSLRISAT